MTKNEEIKNIGIDVLSNQNYISFFSGMIVNGYVVGISLNETNTYYHWIAFFIGLSIGFICYCLIRICQNFDDLCKSEEINDPKKKSKIIKECIWKSFIIEGKGNKVFGQLPGWWILRSIFLIPILLCFGIASLYFGNKEKRQRTEEKTNQEQSVFLSKIDSVLYLHSQDSTAIRKIDSLSNHIRTLEERIKALQLAGVK